MGSKFIWPDSGTKKIIRETFFQISDEDLSRDIEIIREWIKKQPHLPPTALNDDFIEKSLLRNKFSVERTKERLENYYTYKSLHLETFKPIEVLLPSETNDIVIPLPELTDNYERVILVKVNYGKSVGNVDSSTDVMKFLKHTMCGTEFYLRNDYPVGVRIVQDLDGLTFEDFTRFAPKIRPYASMYQEAYFSRVNGIEYVNIPGFVDIFLQCCRALLSPKVFKRITIHKSFESLHKNVNVKFLPREYGGEGKTISEYLEIWENEFKPNVTAIEDILCTEISNESLRIGDVRLNEAFGSEGTFKSLSID